MIDPVSLAKIKAVHPALGTRVVLLVSDFEETVPTDTLVVAQALRSWAEQQSLWAKGRDANGKVIDSGAIVTNAPPGYSWHEYGLAVDLVPESLLNDSTWDPASKLWTILTQLAQARGLACGSCWVHKDLPHVQLTGVLGVSPDAWARSLYAQGGLPEVWNASGIKG